LGHRSWQCRFADTDREHQANVEKWYALRKKKGEM